MTLPLSIPIIIPLDELASGENINDVLTWNGETWVSGTPNESSELPPAFSGQALVYDGLEWVGSSSIRGVTFTNTNNATLTIVDDKTLTYNNNVIFSNDDDISITFPSTNDTLSGITLNQTYTNKTLTRPVITSGSTPVGTTGMLYFDSTENLLCMFNGVFWQYFGMYKIIIVTIPGLVSSSNDGIFYAIPVVSAMGTLDTANLTGLNVPVNGWASSGRIFYQATTVVPNVGISSPVQNNYMEYNYGDQSAGIYTTIFTTMNSTIGGIIDVTEVTTSTFIGVVDTYCSQANGMLYDQYKFTFRFNGNAGANATLRIRWTSSIKNSSSSNFGIKLANSIILIRVG